MKVRARVNGQNVEVIPDWTPEQQADWDMSEDTAEYVLLRENNRFWYVCPAEKVADAQAFFDAVRLGTDDPEVKPDWLVKIGGSPTLVKFTGYRIGKCPGVMLWPMEASPGGSNAS